MNPWRYFQSIVLSLCGKLRDESAALRVEANLFPVDSLGHQRRMLGFHILRLKIKMLMVIACIEGVE